MASKFQTYIRYDQGKIPVVWQDAVDNEGKIVFTCVRASDENWRLDLEETPVSTTKSCPWLKAMLVPGLTYDRKKIEVARDAVVAWLEADG